MRADSPGQTLKLRLREYSGSTRVGVAIAQVALTTSWQLLYVTYSPSAPGASTLDCNAYVTGAAPGECFSADDAAIELDPTPTPSNLVPNAGFEDGLSGWNTSGSTAGVALTRERDGHSGGRAANLTQTATIAATCTLNDTPNVVSTTATGTYTASLWVRAAAAGQTLKTRLREYSAGTLVGSQTTTLTLTTSWQPARVMYTVIAGGSSTLDLNAYLSGAPPGTCFVADDAAVHSP